MYNTVNEVRLELDIQALKYEFSRRLPTYQFLEIEGKYILEHVLNNQSVKVHNILSRIKSEQSFIDKVKNKEVENPFEEITDIVGLRVVCLFLSDIEKIEEVISNNFDVTSKDNKVMDAKNQNTFGYMSAHYIVKIKENYTGVRYDSIKNISFEIQVRTISMDAWANISHFLEYKTENDIPSELKRDFNALSGLFYVADTHFEMFYKQSLTNMEIVQTRVEDIIQHKNRHEYEQEVNLNSISTYMKKKFPNRGEAESNSVSKLVTELLESKYKTIDIIDKTIDSSDGLLEKFEEYLHKENKTKTNLKFNHVGAIRVILAFNDESFRQNVAIAITYFDDFKNSKYYI